jgi:hypothetical protein
MQTVGGLAGKPRIQKFGIEAHVVGTGGLRGRNHRTGKQPNCQDETKAEYRTKGRILTN